MFEEDEDRLLSSIFMQTVKYSQNKLKSKQTEGILEIFLIFPTMAVMIAYVILLMMTGLALTLIISSIFMINTAYQKKI